MTQPTGGKVPFYKLVKNNDNRLDFPIYGMKLANFALSLCSKYCDPEVAEYDFIR